MLNPELKGSFYYSANPHDEEELCIRILKILVELINSQKASSELTDGTSDGDETDSPRRLTPRSHLLIHYFSTEQQSSLQKEHDKSSKGNRVNQHPHF